MSSNNFEASDVPDDLFDCAQFLRLHVIGLTTDGGDESAYLMARDRLMQDHSCKKLLPQFVRHSKNAASLKLELFSVASGSGSWEVRRNYVRQAFDPLLTFLESGGGAADGTITDGLGAYDAPAIHAFWEKAVGRRAADPDGAVTAASTLLEEVCKHIIEDNGSNWEPKWSVPKL